MANIQSHPSNLQSAKTLRSAYFCYFLAALVMCVTAWFIVEGIQATEPDSPARHAKVAAGVLLLVLEGCVFSLAGQYQKHSLYLRLLGWSIFALQITLMTLANYSVGATAGKAAARSKDTIGQLTAQADAARSAAKTLQESAAKQSKSKHSWVNVEAGKNATAAADQTAAAGVAVEKLERLQAASVSTPLVETIGETGLMVLSGALSLIMEAAGIVLMHVAGSLRREASGAPPVDVQILELLHRVHGVPAVIQAAPQLAIESKPVAPAKTAPEAAKPIYSTWTGKSVPLATLGALGALGAAQTVHAAPAVPAVRATPPVNVDPPTPVNVDAPAPVKKERKARVRDASMTVMDTGVGEHDGYRYRRALAAVKAGQINPSRDGLLKGVGASVPTAKRYIEAMALAGEIMPNPNGSGWVLASKGGAA